MAEYQIFYFTPCINSLNTNIVNTMQIVILVFSVIGSGTEVDSAGPEEATDSQASTRTPLGPGISIIFVNDGFPVFQGFALVETI